MFFRRIGWMLATGVLVLVISASPAHAATLTAVHDGSWLVGSTWDSGTVPAQLDDVVIPVGITVTLPNDPQITNVMHGGTTTVNGTFINNNLLITGNITIASSGVLVNNRTLDVFRLTVIVNNGTLTNNAFLTQFFGGTVQNNGVVTNSATGSHWLQGTFTNNGTYNNFGLIHDIQTFDNIGTLNMFCGATITNGTITGNPPVVHSC